MTRHPTPSQKMSPSPVPRLNANEAPAPPRGGVGCLRPSPRARRTLAAALLACAVINVPAASAAHAFSAAQTAGPARGAKTPEAKPRSPKPRDAKSRDAKSRDARAEKMRRAAVAVLLEVAGGAKALEDGFQRASVLTLCADALWEADEQAARAVFGRAWEAAAESDEAELKDERENGRYGDLPERFTRARNLVLASAARRDARLSETWLGALADWLSRQESSAREEAAAEGGGAGTDIGPLNEFTRDGQRLALASSLVDEEAYDAAARVAAPALRGGVSGALVEFLLSLREGSPEEADRLYLQLLASLRAHKGATANDVLLASSYALTPRLLAAVNPDGSVSFRPVGGPRETGEATPPVAPSAVRSAFYDTAAAVLLARPAPPAAPGREPHAVYFAIGRLLPFFELESPRHAHALQARMAELAAALEGARRASLDSQMETRSLSPHNPSDPLRGLLDTAAAAGDAALRDAARLQAVEAAAKRRLWERARRVAEEMEDAETRRAARALIDAFRVAWVREAFEHDDAASERAAALAREAEVTPALRAYGLAQAAQFAARRGDRERASALLEETFGQASQAEAGTYARDAALMLAATVAARLDSPRVWEMLAAAVAALNQDEEFAGEPIWFNTETRADYGRGVAGALDEALGEFDVGGMFDAAARVNFERAVAEARNLRSAGARSRALAAAARAELGRAGPARPQARPGR